MIGSREIGRDKFGRLAAKAFERVADFGDLAFGFLAFHRQHATAYTDQRKAPFGDPRHRPDSPGDRHVECLAIFTPSNRFRPVAGHRDIFQSKPLGALLEKGRFFPGRFDEQNLCIGPDDGQGNPGHAAAGADIRQAKRAGRQLAEQRQGVADMLDFGRRSIDDACEIHRRIGGAQVVEKRRQSLDLCGRQINSRAGRQLSP